MATSQLDTLSGQIIEQNFQLYRDEIIQWLNPREILNHLQQYLVKDRARTISEMMESKTRHKCAKAIMSAIEATARENGTHIYSIFLECVENEPNHMGHKDIAALLRGEGKKLQSDPQVSESQNIQENMSKFMHSLEDINIGQLVPHLNSVHFLTPHEHECLTSGGTTDGDKIQRLKNLVGTKGPKGPYIFAQCLKSEDEHPTHRELYDLLTSNREFSINKTRKRKHSEKSNLQLVVKVARRSPDPLSAEELSSVEYLEIMTDLRKLHLMGRWDEAEELVWQSAELATLNRESKIAIQLESCTGFISRRMGDVVVSRVEKARIEVERLNTESDSIDTLLGRCEWVLAKYYRYSGDLEEAKKHIQEATCLHSGTTSGEDKALTNYCHACILLERLTVDKYYSNSRQHQIEADRAKKCLVQAIEAASSGDYGLDLSHPHIRLAQLCLGSSPTQPGCLKDEQGLEKASSSLQAVKYDSLATRTQCIYWYTKSDLHRNKGESEQATKLAEKALSIAKEHGFTTEIKSVECRLAKLAEQQQMSSRESTGVISAESHLAESHLAE